MVPGAEGGALGDQTVHRVGLHRPAAVADPGAGVLVHAQGPGHAEEISPAGQGGGFVDPDEHPAFGHPGVQGGDQVGVGPGVPAAPGGARPAGVDDHIHPIQLARLHVRKA